MKTRAIKNFELHGVSFVNHKFHGPWETKDGVCRGCGVGMILKVEESR